MVYALGFALEKVAAMQEHGIKGMCSISNVGQIAKYSLGSILQRNLGTFPFLKYIDSHF